MGWQSWVSLGSPALHEKNINFVRHHQSLFYTTQVCGSVSCSDQKRFLWTSEKELSMLIGVEGVTKPFVKIVRSTNPLFRQIVYKWRKFNTIVTLSRSGRTKKTPTRARCTIIQEVTNNSRVTSKDLQASLTLANVSVHESTISGKHWIRMVCMGQ